MGFTAFGGPPAHIAMMQRECVARRGWLDERRFLDMLAVTNLLPGPNSTEMAIHLGHARAGWPGLLVAGAAFIGPAALLTLLIAWVYEANRDLAWLRAVFGGIQPVMWVVIVAAVATLGRKAVTGGGTAAVAVAAAVSPFVGVSELIVLAAAGLAGWLTADRDAGRKLAALLPLPTALPPMAAEWPALVWSATPDRLPLMGWYFLKTGATLFGSGYLVVGLLRADFVTREGWLTEAELLDAIAVGQFTPGPVLSAATFIGYRLGGVAGAALATAAMFLPAFLAVAAVSTGGRFERLRSAPALSAALTLINAAVVGLMAAAAVQLIPATFAPGGTVSAFSLCAAAASAGLVLGLGLNPTWLIIPAGLAGWMASGG
jgi:chromate transporter